MYNYGGYYYDNCYHDKYKSDGLDGYSAYLRRKSQGYYEVDKDKIDKIVTYLKSKLEEEYGLVASVHKQIELKAEFYDDFGEGSSKSYLNERPDICVFSIGKVEENTTVTDCVPELVVDVLENCDICDYSGDFFQKAMLYSNFGVHEYWVVNAVDKEVKVYVLKHFVSSFSYFKIEKTELCTSIFLDDRKFGQFRYLDLSKMFK